MVHHLAADARMGGDGVCLRLCFQREAAGGGDPEAERRYRGKDVCDVCHNRARERPMIDDRAPPAGCNPEVRDLTGLCGLPYNLGETLGWVLGLQAVT